MNPSAHVTSVPALIDFRGNLCAFVEQAKDALVTLDMEIRRSLDSLHEQLAFWKTEIRASEDAVFQAKSELTRKRIMRIGDRPVDTTEQEEALARAIHRLQTAEEKYARTKHWLIALPEEIREYEGTSRIFQGTLETALPKMINLLEQKIATLEAYRRS